MHDHSSTGVEPGPEEHGPLWTPTARRWALLGLIAALCIVLVVVVPPYFSLNRYQRRVASAIGGALGRPVHFDSITVHFLPIPGLTITNFVVSESPEFGWEPVMRANTVDARIRMLSLWRRRIEISRISLDGPSINLVRRTTDGRWNLQGILMQASQLQSAPTAQRSAGEAPRFPYIEATDARINIKNGDLKLPFSIKEAEFALWLPEPDQWHLRIVGKPVRTDTDVNDVGLLRVDATLGRAADLPNAPITLEAGWKPTPLGEAAKLTAGYDLGWRGDVYATAALHGTLGAGRLVTDVHLHSLHRADLLPDHVLDVDAHCEAATAGLLRSLQDVRCAIPTDDSLSLAGVLDSLRHLPSAGDAAATSAANVKPGVLLVQGDVPNVLDWHTANGAATLHGVAPEYGLTWARLFTRSISPSAQVTGSADFAALLRPVGDVLPRWTASLACDCVLPRPVLAAQIPEGLAAPAGANRWGILFHATAAASASPQSFEVTAAPIATIQDAPPPTSPLDIEPTESAPITASLMREGYSIGYDSPAAVAQAAAVIPKLTDGMPKDTPKRLNAHAGWHTPQLWDVEAAAPIRIAPAHRRKVHRR